MTNEAPKVTYELHAEASESTRAIRYTFVTARHQHLTSLMSGASEGAWQYLLAVNGGAAAGMLAFIGAVPDYRCSKWPYLALLLFVLGLLLVGVARAALVHIVNHVLTGWNSAIEVYYDGRSTWSEMSAADDQNVKKLAWLPWLLGWASLILFAAGVVYVAWSFWHFGTGDGKTVICRGFF